MINNPLVSVIIPNYNHASFLDERIQSVLNQTYHNFEVFILDDNSTDNSLEIIYKYKDNPHISQIVINEINSGSPFKQWHKGFELAKGELIWIAESDDSCENTFLEALVESFIEDPECVMAFCRSIMIDEDGNKLRPAIKGHGDEKMKGIDFIREYMSIGCETQNASSVIFKKDVALKMPSLYMECKGAGDRMFFAQIAEYGNVAIYDKQLNHYRQHGDNTTNMNFVKGINQREDKKIMDYLCSKGYADPIITKQRCFYYIENFIYLYPIESWKLKKEIICLWDGSLKEYRLWMFRRIVHGIKRRVLNLLKLNQRW